MSDDTPDLTEATHSRGSDGQLLPVTETVDIHGAEYEVRVKPATTGERNEWLQRLDDEGDELSAETTADLLDTFAGHDPADFGASSWDDVRPAITDALGETVLARLFDAEDTAAFREALEEAGQGNQG